MRRLDGGAGCGACGRGFATTHSGGRGLRPATKGGLRLRSGEAREAGGESPLECEAAYSES